MVTTTVAVVPPVLGSRSAGRSRGTPERLAQLVRRGSSGFRGLPVHAGAVPGCGVAEQCLPQHRAVQGGDREPAVALAVAVLGHPEHRGRLRLPLLLSSSRASWASPTSGATTSRIRLPRVRRSFASWSAAYPTNVATASSPDGRVEVVGQRLHRGHDHLRLVHQQPPLGQPDPDRLEHLRPQRGSQPGLPVRRGTGLPGGVRPPVRRRRWHPTRPPPAPSAHGAARRASSSATAAASRVASTSAARVSAAVIDHAGWSRSVFSSSTIRDSTDPDRVSPTGAVHGACHGSIRPAGTDTSAPLGQSCGYRCRRAVCGWKVAHNPMVERDSRRVVSRLVANAPRTSTTVGTLTRDLAGSRYGPRFARGGAAAPCALSRRPDPGQEREREATLDAGAGLPRAAPRCNGWFRGSSLALLTPQPPSPRR